MIRMHSQNPSSIQTTRPRQRSGIRAYEIDGEAVLYDLARDTVHYLNRTAWLIWRLCDGGAREEDISQKVAVTFDLLPQQAGVPDSILHDTRMTLHSLAVDGLIDWAGGSESGAYTGEITKWPD